MSSPYSEGMKRCTPAVEAAVTRDGVRWMSEPVRWHITVWVFLKWVEREVSENVVLMCWI